MVPCPQWPPPLPFANGGHIVGYHTIQQVHTTHPLVVLRNHERARYADIGSSFAVVPMYKCEFVQGIAVAIGGHEDRPAVTPSD